MIGRRLAHYEILSKLGDGGMGVVYKAQDTHLDRLVAIKLLPPEFVADPERKRRFTQEAKAASALNHPNIITVYDIAQAEGTDFIAMEYVQGKTLGELIGRKGLRLKDTLTYATQAASALAKAHAVGIIHRDLKPSNIMVTDDGHVKILDFGVAKLTSADADDSKEAQWASTPTRTAHDRPHTEAGKIVGTVAYMSPEQAEGRTVDARSDIFSFGAVLYEMVTGARAFQGTSAVVTLSAVINAEPKPPGQLAKDLPRDLERIILRCLRKDPARRVQFMADLAVELEEIKAESGSQIAVAQGAARERRTPWLIASALVVLLIAAGAWLLRPKAVAGLPPPKVGPLTSLPGNESFPALSPDGTQVAFTWNGGSGENEDIYVQRVGAESPSRVTTDPATDTSPVWSPDGSRIAFLRRGSNSDALYAASVPGGSEVKLAELDPMTAPYPAQPVLFTNPQLAWSPDGHWLAVTGDRRKATAATQASEGAGILLVPADEISPGGRSPRLLLPTAGSIKYYESPAFSPRGDALAHVGCDTSLQCRVYVVGLTSSATRSGPPRRLTTEFEVVAGLAWNEVGTDVIYSAASVWLNTFHLWRVAASGERPPERMDLAGTAALPSMSRVGHRLAFSRRDLDLNVWQLDGDRPPTPIVSSSLSDYDAYFSPDGTRIAFVTDRRGDGSEVWTAHSDGTGLKSLTKGAQRTLGSPRWSPNGKWLAFDGKGEDGYWHVSVIDAEGGAPRLLTPAPLRGNLPSWSADGQWIYFGDLAPVADVWRTRLEGGDVHQVTHGGGSAALEAPDGKTLYFLRNTLNGRQSVWAMPLAGGSERQILDSVRGWMYWPVAGGIYYVPQPAPNQPRDTAEVRYLDLVTGRSRLIRAFNSEYLRNGLSVSPSGTVLVTGATSISVNLMLIERFR